MTAAATPPRPYRRECDMGLGQRREDMVEVTVLLLIMPESAMCNDDNLKLLHSRHSFYQHQNVKYLSEGFDPYMRQRRVAV